MLDLLIENRFPEDSDAVDRSKTEPPAGPPSRPLPRIVLEARGEQLIAIEVKG